ncbi:MAG TPA: glycosyltransferase family 4 protein [Bacteroidaceae bacterium]|nr:glycosyltransferase family 4 protein [Bacteroidaceae bacterium]
MKFALITSMNLPVPAFRGGAVENLVDMYLKYNKENAHHEFTVYTLQDTHHYDGTLLPDPYTKYVTINTNSLWYRCKNFIFRKTIGQYYSNGYWDFFLKECLDRIQQEDYDLIIVENRGEFAPRIKEVLGDKMPILFHMHNEFYAALHKLPEAKIIFSACDVSVCISDYIADVVHQNLPTAITETVFNGIDEQRFKNVVPDYETFKVQKDDFIIAYSGRIIQEKGVKELIQAIKLCQDIPRLKLLIIGGSSYGLGNEQLYMSEVRELAEELRDIVIVTGFVSYENVPSILATANIVVVPSLWEEPAGLSAIEPLHLGKPMIVTKSGGIPQMTGDAAIIVEKNIDRLPQLLADNIHLLYNNPEKREGLKQAALIRSLRFTSEVYAKNMIAIMEKYAKRKV